MQEVEAIFGPQNYTLDSSSRPAENFVLVLADTIRKFLQILQFTNFLPLGYIKTLPSKRVMQKCRVQTDDPKFGTIFCTK